LLFKKKNKKNDNPHTKKLEDSTEIDQYIEGDNYKYKIIDKNLKENKFIKEKHILHQNVGMNDNNRNDGSIKNLLSGMNGQIIKKEINLIDTAADEQESESEEESDYEGENYNHFLRNRNNESDRESEEDFEKEDDNAILHDDELDEIAEDRAQSKIKQKFIQEPNTFGKKKERHIQYELFAENMPTDKNEKEIVKFFRNLSVGVKIDRIKVIKNNKTFLKFTSKEEAEKLLKIPIKFENCKIKLSFARDNSEKIATDKNFNSEKNVKINFKRNNNLNEEDNDVRDNTQFNKKNPITSSIKNNSHTIFIRNLPLSIDDSTLIKNFKQFGKISSIRLMKTKDGKSKGFGYIDFKSEDSLVKAIDNSSSTPIIIEGKQVAIEKAKSSFNEFVYEEGKRLGKKKKRQEKEKDLTNN
jgi:hypothetical protein